MNGVYIVENKIGYETKILLSKLKKSGKYDYEVTFKENEGKVESATVDFFRIIVNNQNGNGKELIGSTKFTIYDAARIGLINKSAYKNYPQLMMFYRAASNGMKMYCPDILDGAALAEDYIEVVSNQEEKETEIKFDKEKITIGNNNEQEKQ
jgi:hypothetical protein